MSDKIVTEAPKHSEQLLSAVENALKAHSLRLKPDQDLDSIVDAVAAHGFKLSEQFGYLNASQTNNGIELAAHVNAIFEGLAAKEPTRFYPRSVDNIESRDAMDKQGKMQYIAKHGLKAYENLPQTAPTIKTVVLNRSALTRAEYLSLPSSQRAELCGQWGASQIGAIMSRTK